MNGREWILTALFAGFLVFKIVEVALGLESWPASNVSMFSGYRPRQFVPLRSHLRATRDGAAVELSHFDFSLSRDEFLARLHPDGQVGARCFRLVESYNRTAGEPARRLEGAIVVVEPVSRPGIFHDVVSWTVPCVPSGAKVQP